MHDIYAHKKSTPQPFRVEGCCAYHLAPLVRTTAETDTDNVCATSDNLPYEISRHLPLRVYAIDEFATRGSGDQPLSSAHHAASQASCLNASKCDMPQSPTRQLNSSFSYPTASSGQRCLIYELVKRSLDRLEPLGCIALERLNLHALDRLKNSPVNYHRSAFRCWVVEACLSTALIASDSVPCVEITSHAPASHRLASYPAVSRSE